MPEPDDRSEDPAVQLAGMVHTFHRASTVRKDLILEDQTPLVRRTEMTAGSHWGRFGQSTLGRCEHALEPAAA